MRKLLASILAVAVLLCCHLGADRLQAQQLPLSAHASASIITCGPGDDFYTTFGHSAIRICDTSVGVDMVYNYGTFNFGTPNFYWQFTRGMLDYHLSRSSFSNFMAVYEYEQRAVWEQPLNLNSQEVNNLYVLLETNYLPDYRYYRYDFFRDNCATRVRDMVAAACGKDTVRYPDSVASRHMSYRNYVHQATGPTLQWWTLGIDLLLGLPTDHRCDVEEAMFYPIVMMQEYATASRNGSALTQQCRQLLEDTRTPQHRSFPPLVVFLLLLAGVSWLTWWQLKEGQATTSTRIVDRVLFTVAGLIGLFLLFMWFGTDHYCTAWNLNILWASPLLLLIAIRLGRSPRWALWLQEACFAVAAVWVLCCGLSLALLPIVIALALRVATSLKIRE